MSNFRRKKNILIISDSLENERFSVSKMMTDLIINLSKKNYNINIITQTPRKTLSDKIYKASKKILFCKNFFIKSEYYFLRGISELLFSIQISKHIFFSKKKYDSTIWYSPSIFIGLGLYLSFRKINLGKKILIIRDIFPDWLVDVNILSKNSLRFYILKYVEKFQYIISDNIIAQSYYDKNTILNNKLKRNIQIDILYSWYHIDDKISKDFKIKDLPISTPYVLHLGNIDIAQDFNKFSDFIINVSQLTPNISYLFVGLREIPTKMFKTLLKSHNIKNVFIYKSVGQDYVPNLCKNAICGIFTLNSNLKTNNIPGRFIMYALNGLKSFGIFDNNQELTSLIYKNKLGLICSINKIDICQIFLSFLTNKNYNPKIISKNANKKFSIDSASQRISSIIGS